MSIDQIISIVCNIFTAVGTVGAVVVALWFGFLGYKDKQPLRAMDSVVVASSPR